MIQANLLSFGIDILIVNVKLMGYGEPSNATVKSLYASYFAALDKNKQQIC